MSKKSIALIANEKTEFLSNSVFVFPWDNVETFSQRDIQLLPDANARYHNRTCEF